MIEVPLCVEKCMLLDVRHFGSVEGCSVLIKRPHQIDYASTNWPNLIDYASTNQIDYASTNVIDYASSKICLNPLSP